MFKTDPLGKPHYWNLATSIMNSADLHPTV
jgi:hypothetical protein